MRDKGGRSYIPLAMELPSSDGGAACPTPSQRDTSSVTIKGCMKKPTHRRSLSLSQEEDSTYSSGNGSSIFTSCSAPEETGYMMPPSQRALSQPSDDTPDQQQRSRQENLVLLRRSLHYKTKLKESDPPQGSDDLTEPKSKFELSSAWTSLLSKSNPSPAPSEPLDGAYDLFSLPSDSSLTATSRCDSNDRSFDNIISLATREDLSVSSIPRQRKVSFDSTVKGVTIPSRFSYSNRTRINLWSSTEDIQQNLARNEKEYSYDGNDWRTAKEESDFLRCSSSSSSSSIEDLVHPAHFSNRSSSQPYWNSGSASIPSSRNDDYTSNAKERVEEDADYSEGIFEMD